MKLLSVDVRNYRAIKESKFRFTDDLGRVRPVTVIAGPNGSGKTSILWAIVQTLRGVLGYRTNDVPAPTRDDMRKEQTTSEWIKEPPSIQVKATVQFDSEEQEAIPALLKILGQGEPPKLDRGELTVNWIYPPNIDESSGVRRPSWTASVAPTKRNVRLWLSARKLAIQAWRRREDNFEIRFLDQIGGIKFFPQERVLKRRALSEDRGPGLSITSEPIAPDAEGETGSEPPRDREESLTDILYRLSHYVRTKGPGLPDAQNWEKRIQDLFHQICGPKEYLGYHYRGETDPVGAPLFRDGDQEYPITQVADGESVILEYITEMIYPSPLSHSIILIDEPELHLHPAWIRQLYLALPKIGESNQYILTTHSPELRDRAASDGALIDLGPLGTTL